MLLFFDEFFEEFCDEFCEEFPLVFWVLFLVEFCEVLLYSFDELVELVEFLAIICLLLVLRLLFSKPFAMYYVHFYKKNSFFKIKGLHFSTYDAIILTVESVRKWLSTITPY